MRWEQIPLGPIQTNAYLLVNDKKECLIIDPGGEGEKLEAYLKENNWTPLAILLTHAHFDHIGAVDHIRDVWNIELYIHKNEEDWLQRPEYNGSGRHPAIPDIILKKADNIIEREMTLSISDFSLKVLETPGHSPGSVSYYDSKHGVVFSGDALFAGSIGRTDLFGGSMEQLLDSIHSKLLTLPEETIVSPGHGPETTIAKEMDTNPFLHGF